jgi:hypothetical protein
LFGGPERVLKYLARYTHRVALSNHRLVALRDGLVSFRWKDYADGHAEKVMTVEAFEFIRRFLLHVVPPGFVRLRHYGLLANRHRERNLQTCSRLLGQAPPVPAPEEPGTAASPEPTTAAAETRCCPACQKGRMVIVQLLPVDERACDRYRRVPICNTS